MRAFTLQFASLVRPFIDVQVQDKQTQRLNPFNQGNTAGPAPYDFRTQLEQNLGPSTPLPEKSTPLPTRTEAAQPPRTENAQEVPRPGWMEGFVRVIMAANAGMTEAQARRIAFIQLQGQIAFASAHPMPGEWEGFGGRFVNGRFVGQVDQRGNVVKTPEQVLEEARTGRSV